MKGQQIQEIVKIIDNYLIVMPNAPHYNICRQQETKHVLEQLINRADHIDDNLLNKDALLNFLKNIQKWNGVTSEPEDVEFQLLILNAQTELRNIRARLQSEFDVQPG